MYKYEKKPTENNLFWRRRK